MENSYLAKPSSPLRDVLHSMTGVEPPAFVRGYSSTKLTDDEQLTLQDWAMSHVKPTWLTGIGLLDAADAQVAEAVANGNIPPPNGGE